jgi:hypothetical protein
MSMEWFISPIISMGGSNPFGSLASSKNLKLGMEFEEARVGNNKLMQGRFLRECFIGASF